MAEEKNKIVEKNIVIQKDKEKKKKDLELQRKKDSEMVKGIFKFYEVPGGQLSFVYKAYKENPVEKYTLIDGHIYTLPLGVAKHLNKNGCYPVHKHLKDEAGNVSVKIGKKVRRFGFQSLEFVNEEDFITEPSQIITVENI